MILLVLLVVRFGVCSSVWLTLATTRPLPCVARRVGMGDAQIEPTEQRSVMASRAVHTKQLRWGLYSRRRDVKVPLV